METKDYQDLALTLGIQVAQLMEKRAALEVQIREIDIEIQALTKTLRSLNPLSRHSTDSGGSLAGLGLTHAIRNLFDVSKKPLSARGVKEGLEKRGISFAGYKAPMASIYTILTRLRKAEEIEVIEPMEKRDDIYYTKKQAPPQR